MTAACPLPIPERDPPLRFVSAARTHIGYVRTVNEDRFLDRPDRGLWAVADGMGGHSAGDLAAAAAIRALCDLADTHLPIALAGIESALARANAEIRRRARLGGSTVVGLAVEGDRFLAFWVGDSRIYRFRSGALEQVSHDHSVVQELIDAGLLAPERAAIHPQAHVVTRALGPDADPQIAYAEGIVCPGDLFLIASDGLCGPVSDEAIAAELSLAGNAADRLIRRALEAGAPDNITLIVISASAD